MFPGFLFRLSRVKVFGLTGESGTGKSFRAKLVAQKFGIEYIIDDGLLIKDDRILAGHSAKREKNMVAAVRAALFDEKARRDEVAKKLQAGRIRKVLVIGTSERMVRQIAARLQLPPPSKIITIEEVATREEIERALRSRRVEGKHVIPVPSVEVKRSYPQIFYNAVKVFGRGSLFERLGLTQKMHEKSLVRPEYSRRGKVTISGAALSQMVFHCVEEYNGEIKIKKVTVKDEEMGYRLIITIDVPYGVELNASVSGLQQYIIESIERYAGILIEEVNIIIDKIIQ
ncbi:MAG: AAA family ATPase [Treponematales bacterium]